MAKPDATDKEMREVLKKVNLLGFLDTQNGLDTILLERREIFPAVSASVW